VPRLSPSKEGGFFLFKFSPLVFSNLYLLVCTKDLFAPFGGLLNTDLQSKPVFFFVRFPLQPCFLPYLPGSPLLHTKSCAHTQGGSFVSFKKRPSPPLCFFSHRPVPVKGLGVQGSPCAGGKVRTRVIFLNFSPLGFVLVGTVFKSLFPRSGPPAFIWVSPPPGHPAQGWTSGRIGLDFLSQKVGRKMSSFLFLPSLPKVAGFVFWSQVGTPSFPGGDSLFPRSPKGS